MNPYVVAQHLHSPALILGAWVTGGVAALLGAFIYAELAARLPKAGGQYAYLREAMHPAVGFFYGWLALIVINAGGCAAAAVTFARYARELLPFPLPERAIAGTAIVVLAAVNCAGIRAGSAVQSGLMLLRVGAIAILVICGMTCVRAQSLGQVLAGKMHTIPVTVSAAADAEIPVKQTVHVAAPLLRARIGMLIAAAPEAETPFECLPACVTMGNEQLARATDAFKAILNVEMQLPGMSVEPRDERRGALARYTRQRACVHVASRKTVNAQSPVAVWAAAQSLTVRVNPVQAH